MRKIAIASFMACASGFSCFVNADLSSAKTVFRSGNWTVLKDVDTMTDEALCTGIYKGDIGVQLSKDALYIQVQGGLQSIQLRYGEEPAEHTRLPTESEKSLDAVAISGGEFQRLLASKRLRLQSLTLIKGVAIVDLNLDGINPTHENITQGCPERSSEKTPSHKTSLCGDSTAVRLREKGVSQDIIDYACSPS